MSETNEHTNHAVAQLRQEWSPPAGAEARMLADFHRRLDGPPDGGDDPGELPGGSGGGVIDPGSGGHWLFAAKIVAAVTGLTAAGLGGVALVAKLVRGPEDSTTTRSEPASAPMADEPPSVAAAEVAPVDAPLPLVVEAPAPAGSERAPEPAMIEADARTPREEPPGPDLASELALIRQARAAKPAQALALLERHARDFGDGALIREREALRLAALCDLDRLEQARAAVERFAALAPGPLLRERVAAACAEKIDLPTTGSSNGGDGSQQ